MPFLTCSSAPLSMARFFSLCEGMPRRRRKQNLVYFHTHSRLLAPTQAVTGKTREEITLEVQDMSWGTFKPLLADATVEHLVSLCSCQVPCAMSLSLSLYSSKVSLVRRCRARQQDAGSSALPAQLRTRYRRIFFRDRILPPRYQVLAILILWTCNCVETTVQLFLSSKPVTESRPCVPLFASRLPQRPLQARYKDILEDRSYLNKVRHILRRCFRPLTRLLQAHL